MIFGMSVLELVLQGLVAVTLVATMVLLARGRWHARKGFVMVVWLLPVSQMAAESLILHVAFGCDSAWFVPWIVVAVAVLCSVGDVVLIGGLDAAVEKRRADEWLRLLEGQVEFQRSYCKALEAECAKAEAMRAGFVERLADVRAAIEGRKGREALGAVDGAAAVLVPAVQRYCSHRVVDALLVGKGSEFERDGIRFDCAVSIPDDGVFSDLELCAVFSNMLSNAARACADMPEGERWIELRARVMAGNLVVRAKNPCAPGAVGKPLSDRGRNGSEGPLPGGRSVDSHGWGLEILRLIADDHSGSFSAGKRGDRFVAEMVLPVLDVSDQVRRGVQ